MMASEPRVQWPAVLLLLFTLSWFLHIMSGQLTNSRNQHLVSRSANTHLHWPKERFFQADRITRHDMVVEDLQQQPWRQNQGRLVKNINDKSSDLADNKAVLSSQSFETVSMSAPSKASDRLLQLQDLATPPTSKTMQRFSFVPKLVHSGTSSPSSQAQSRSYVERWFEVFHYLPEVSRTQISSLRNKRLAKPRQVDAPSGILALPQTALTKFQQKSKRIPAVLERQEPQKKGIILSRYKLQNASKFRRLRITPLRFHRSKASMKRTQWLKVSTLVGGISTWRFDHGLNSAFHSLHIFDRARKVLHPVGLWLSKKGKLNTVENGVDFRTYHNNRPVRNQGCKNVTQTFPVVNNTNAIRSEINKKLEYDFKKAFLPHSSHKPIQRTSIEHLVRQDQQTSSNSTQLSSELNLLAVQDTNKLNSLDLGSNHKQEKDLSNRTLSRLKRSSKSNNEFTSRRRPASSSEKRSSGLPFRNRFPRPPGDRDSRFPNSRPGTGDRFSNFPGLGNGPGFQPPPLGPGLGTEPQPVSLKVIVHLGVRRGYQRYIDSAITKVTRQQEFLPLIPYIRPTGRLVTLANDNPRDILQAFCTNILEANSTAVFHLINPFYHTRSWSSAQYVANLLTTLNMPVITWGPEYIGTTDKKESDTLQLTISATLQHQVQAMLAVLRHYNWKHFGVVYTPVPGHDAFLTAIRILVNDNNSNTRHSGFKFDIVVQQELSNVSDAATMRRELRDLSMTEARILLLYCLE
ncbi:uncharacterized protein LOC101846202 [Aplysia californica]|uniref:Uncharacterized protein LOC101846202 n=1 Tax=Aplysia californica TaxID=6500 RepID=A0ABM0ZVU4_APLCA|nr:uncharacterized protein LOC101846202 [Aplysia californica]